MFAVAYKSTGKWDIPNIKRYNAFCVAFGKHAIKEWHEKPIDMIETMTDEFEEELDKVATIALSDIRK